VTALAGRIQALIQTWDTRHADWCCTKGCSAPDGWHPRDLATEPCTGECTCDVGLYLTSLRAALEDAGE
jgi:hypothetical protein